MYDTSLTHQSLPDERYLYLLGVSLSVFASNCDFIIENILRTNNTEAWDKLVDKEAGRLLRDVNMTITRNAGPEIAETFDEIVRMRNRIVHGFRITSQNNEQILATKEKTGKQYEIDKGYLESFIRKSDKLSKMLHEYRGY